MKRTVVLSALALLCLAGCPKSDASVSPTSAAANDAQGEEWSIVLHAYDRDLEYMFDSEGLIAWMKRFTELVENHEALPETLGIRVYFEAGEGPTLAFDREGMSKEQLAAFHAAFMATEPPESRFSVCAFEWSRGDRGELVPQDPSLEPLQALAGGDIGDQAAALSQRAETHVLPLLVEMLARGESPNSPARLLSDILHTQLEARSFDARAIYKEPAFWAALTDSADGGARVWAVPVFLEVAAGNIGHAHRMAQLGFKFTPEQLAIEPHLQNLDAWAGQFSQVVAARIGEGIKLFDAGDRVGAMAIYREVVRAYPGSAWAWHEIALTHTVDGQHKTEDTQRVFEADPLYPMQTRARGADAVEAMTARLRLGELFKSPDQLLPDLLAYADIAMTLGEAGEAGIVYWWLTNSGQEVGGLDQLALAGHVLAAAEALEAVPPGLNPGALEAMKAARKRLGRQ